MTESLKLGGIDERDSPRIRRLNRVPIIVAIVLVVALLAVIIYGLTSRGMQFGGQGDGQSTMRPATTDADQLKRGIPDGIIGEPAPVVLQPTPEQPSDAAANPFTPVKPEEVVPSRQTLEPEAIWKARIEREQQEQWLRELQRQRMASLQADAAALDSPIAVDIDTVDEAATATNTQLAMAPLANNQPVSALDLYAAAMKAGAGNNDPNLQADKESFFNQNIADLGYLPKSVVPQMSPYELKRGSVIPATLVTGINSDLPGRITAQVSQNIYDSATGRHLLVPQGSKLFGRYDSKVAFGQNRVLVIWTDIIFPNGSTLQIGGMAGTDAAGYGGFTDKVDNHLLETFGSAILVALIGTGTEMMLPDDNNTGNNGENSARESFAETFGELSEQTVSRNLNVQPTLEIRPGYQFNVLVDQDMVFPGAFQ